MQSIMPGDATERSLKGSRRIQFGSRRSLPARGAWTGVFGRNTNDALAVEKNPSTMTWRSPRFPSEGLSERIPRVRRATLRRCATSGSATAVRGRRVLDGDSRFPTMPSASVPFGFVEQKNGGNLHYLRVVIDVRRFGVVGAG